MFVWCVACSQVSAVPVCEHVYEHVCEHAQAGGGYQVSSVLFALLPRARVPHSAGGLPLWLGRQSGRLAPGVPLSLWPQLGPSERSCLTAEPSS